MQNDSDMRTVLESGASVLAGSPVGSCRHVTEESAPHNSLAVTSRVNLIFLAVNDFFLCFVKFRLILALLFSSEVS